MTRPSDRQNPKSWVVEIKGAKPVLEESRWLPGYTEAHKETELQAISHAIKVNEAAFENLRNQRHYLQMMWDDKHIEVTGQPDFGTHDHNYWIDGGSDQRTRDCSCSIGEDHTDPNTWSD